MKELFLTKIKEEKEKRKRQRVLDRGFKPQELDEEGKPIEDPEILEEKEDFDRQKHETEIFADLFYKVQEVFIVGNFFEVEEEVIATPLNQIMIDSKRLPECVVHLKLQDNEKYLQRVFDRDAILKEHERVMQERREQRQKDKELARQEALANLEEG